MKKRVLMATGVVFVVGAAAWWQWARDAHAAQGSTLQAVRPEPTPSLEDQVRAVFAAAADAGTEMVSGVVSDEEGKPVEGAEVALYLSDSMPDALSAPGCEGWLGCSEPAAIRSAIDRLEAGTFMPRPWATTMTGAGGQFEFPTAPAVLSHLVARKGGLAGASGASRDGVEITIAATAAHTETLKCAGDKPLSGVKVWVVDARFVTALPATSNVDGVVLVHLHGHDAWVLAAPSGLMPETNTIDQELVFGPPRRLVVKTRLGGEPVDAVVEVEGVEHQTHHGEVTIEELRSEVFKVTAHTSALSSRVATVDLSQVDSAELVIELRAGSRLLLTVVDADGMPVKTASASLENAEGKVSASAEEEGAMVALGPVPEGEFTLSVIAEGFRAVRRTIDLTPGDLPLEVELLRLAVLEGGVVDDQGKPVSAADVEYLPAGASPEHTRTDDAGHFSFAGSPVSEATVVASSESTGLGEARVTMPGRITLRLEPRAVIVLDVHTTDRAPLNEARVSLTGPGRAIVSLNEQGHCRIAGLRGGKWTLEVVAAHHPLVVKEVELVEGRELRETIVLAEGVSIEGRVVDQDDKPMADAWVVASNSNESAVTDIEGRFLLKGVSPGTVEVMGVVDHRRTVRQVVEAPASNAVIRMPNLSLVAGRVVDEAGRPMHAFEANGLFIEDPDGRFSVPSDDGQLSIWAEGFDATTLADVHGDVGVVTMKVFQKVVGEVVDAQGRPVAGVSVRIVPGGGNEVFTLANGQFSTSVSNDLEGTSMIVASRGAQFASQRFERGRFARLQLGNGTHVNGRVTKQARASAGVDVVVEAANQLAVGTQTIVTDSRGVFEVDLSPGLWRFSAVGFRASRTVDISGDRFSVELSDSNGSCGLEIKALSDILDVILEPTGTQRQDGYQGAGTIHLSGQPQGLPFIVDGLPCGEFTVSVLTQFGSWSDELLLDAHTVFDATKAVPLPDRPLQRGR